MSEYSFDPEHILILEYSNHSPKPTSLPYFEDGQEDEVQRGRNGLTVDFTFLAESSPLASVSEMAS